MENTSDIPDDLITVKEAARLVHNTHTATIRRWVLNGKLQGYTLAGTRWLVSRADVLALIQPLTKPRKAPAIESPRQRGRRERDTDRVLRAAGVRK